MTCTDPLAPPVPAGLAPDIRAAWLAGWLAACRGTTINHFDDDGSPPSDAWAAGFDAACMSGASEVVDVCR